MKNIIKSLKIRFSNKFWLIGNFSITEYKTFLKNQDKKWMYKMSLIMKHIKDWTNEANVNSFAI